MSVPSFQNLTGAGTVVLVPAVAGRVAVLTWLLLSGDASTSNTFQIQGTSGANLTGQHPIGAGATISTGLVHFASAPGEGIQIVTSGGNMVASFGPSYL